MVRQNVVVDKSKAFAVRIIRMYQWLSKEKREFVLSKQCLRCGTSIGANLYEGMNGQSTADFIAKLHTALKEANETDYWLELMKETDYITPEMYDSIHSDCVELIKLITSIIKTTKLNNNIKL